MRVHSGERRAEGRRDKGARQDAQGWQVVLGAEIGDVGALSGVRGCLPRARRVAPRHRARKQRADRLGCRAWHGRRSAVRAVMLALLAAQVAVGCNRHAPKRWSACAEGAGYSGLEAAKGRLPDEGARGQLR